MKNYTLVRLWINIVSYEKHEDKLNIKTRIECELQKLERKYLFV